MWRSKRSPPNDFEKAYALAGDPWLQRLAVQAWATADREAVVAWLLQAEQRETSSGLLVDLIASRAGDAPHDALAQARSLDDKTLRNGAVGAVLGRWAAYDFDAAFAEVQDELRRDPQPLRMLDEFANYASGLPPAQLAALAGGLPAGVTRDQFIAKIAPELSDPEQTTALIGLIGHEATRNEALLRCVTAWARNAPDLSAHYLSAMPESPDRDRAIEMFSEPTIRTAPELAIGWAQRISAGKKRKEQVGQLLRTWEGIDAEAAQAWRAANAE